MYKKGLERIAWLLVGSVACGTAAEAQLPNPYREISEPGIVGARIHPGALAPAIRKWYLPQNLYYEYRWRGWEYSNYAREAYQRYVGTLLNGERLYDPLGNYIARGWEIYDWTETNPRSFGSSLLRVRASILGLATSSSLRRAKDNSTRPSPSATRSARP